jgi:hypothetical protein
MQTGFNQYRKALAHIALALVLSGCVAYGETTVVVPASERRFNIPEGHRPPPGECRIWFPDRPPGQQPPPGNCFDLQRQVPPGAVLVRG